MCELQQEIARPSFEHKEGNFHEQFEKPIK